MSDDHNPKPDTPEEGLSRREFLERAGLGLAAAGLASGASAQGLAPTEKPGSPPPQPRPPERRVGWALVGLGQLSLDQLLPAFELAQKSRVTALVSGDPVKARRMAEQYGIDPKGIYTYRNYDTMRDNPDIDVVYVVLPNGLHAEYSVRASRAGKHVFSEKPMANTPEECEQMIAAARQARRLLGVAYRARFEPRHVDAARIAQAGGLGKLKVMTGEFIQNQGDPNQWRLDKELAGGGALPDIGIYPLNYARFVTREEPTQIRAHIYSTPGDARFREVEEAVTFTLQFPSGAIGHFATSYGGHRSSRFRITGERAWADLNPAFQYEGNRLILSRRVGLQEGVEERVVENKNQFTLEIDAFSESVLTGAPFKAPGETGLADQRLVEAIYRAARSGEAVNV